MLLLAVHRYCSFCDSDGALYKSRNCSYKAKITRKLDLLCVVLCYSLSCVDIRNTENSVAHFPYNKMQVCEKETINISDYHSFIQLDYHVHCIRQGENNTLEAFRQPFTLNFRVS